MKMLSPQNTVVLIAAAFLLCTTGDSVAALKKHDPNKEVILRVAMSIILPELEFENATPAEALKAISAMSGIEIFYTPMPGDKPDITVSLRNIPTSEALRYITGLSGLGFAYESKGVRIFKNAAPPVGAK